MASITRQLLVFFGLAYLISWTVWLPLFLPEIGIPLFWPASYQHAAGGLGPLLAAFITTAIFQKKEGVVQLAKALFTRKPLPYLFIALVGPFVLNVIAGGMALVWDGQPFDLTGLGKSREFPGFSLPAFFLYNLLFFGFGEETGWRGFALPRLQNRYKALTASLLLSVFWAVWHWPLFLYRPGYTGMDAGGVLGWWFSLATGSVLLTWLFNSSRGSLLACAIFHATVDIAFTADFAVGQLVAYTGFLITLCGLAVVWRFKPRHLSNRPRIKTILE